MCSTRISRSKISRICIYIYYNVFYAIKARAIFASFPLFLSPTHDKNQFSFFFRVAPQKARCRNDYNLILFITSHFFARLRVCVCEVTYVFFRYVRILNIYSFLLVSSVRVVRITKNNFDHLYTRALFLLLHHVFVCIGNIIYPHEEAVLYLGSRRIYRRK